MGEEISNGEARVLSLGMRVSVLMASFIYTAITLLLMGLENPSIFLWQVTLFVLQIAFTSALFDTYLTLFLAAGVLWKHWPIPKIMYIADIFHLISASLWMLSISLMFFARNLLFLGLVQLFLTLVFFLLVSGFARRHSREDVEKLKKKHVYWWLHVSLNNASAPFEDKTTSAFPLAGNK